MKYTIMEGRANKAKAALGVELSLPSELPWEVPSGEGCSLSLTNNYNTLLHSWQPEFGPMYV